MVIIHPLDSNQFSTNCSFHQDCLHHLTFIKLPSAFSKLKIIKIFSSEIRYLINKVLGFNHTSPEQDDNQNCLAHHERGNEIEEKEEAETLNCA